MSEHVIVLLVPGLRESDLAHMPTLTNLAADIAPLVASFPCVSAVVQTSMTTGLLPQDHGIVGDDRLSWYELLSHGNQPERIWTTIRGYDANFRCALVGLAVSDPETSHESTPEWWQQHPKTATLPSPSGTDEATARLSQAFCGVTGHPQLLIARLPHLDGPGHLHGPASVEFAADRAQLDADIQQLVAATSFALAKQQHEAPPLWLVASEYLISPIEKTVHPNRLLRQCGWLQVSERDAGQAVLEFSECVAWALADYQVAHVFVRGNPGDPSAEEVACVFRGVEGIAEVLDGEGKRRRDLDHPAAGDLVLVAAADATFSGEFSSRADWEETPDLAWHDWSPEVPGHQVPDISTKPERQPGPLFRGSHGAPAEFLTERGIVLASEPGVLLGGAAMADFDLAGLVLRQFGI